jgi:hypothetical protein
MAAALVAAIFVSDSMDKIKTYVITLSPFFLKGHPKVGKPTRFRCKFLMGRNFNDACMWDCSFDGKENTRRSCSRNAIVENGIPWNFPKIHTIRTNYKLWEKRIREVQEGNAVLSIRQWSGKPYRSKQTTILNLTKDDGVGIQPLKITKFVDKLDNKECVAISVDGKIKVNLTLEEIAHNDGLSFEDWAAWFKGADTSQNMAIIHFTSFRYE